MRCLSSIVAAGVILAASALAMGQAVAPVVGGVAITPEGLLQMGRMTAPAPARPGAGDPSLTYISLPGALAQWKAAREAKTDPPAEVRFLKGLTRVEKVFVYAAGAGDKPGDIVLAGRSEPLSQAETIQAVGAISGRPALQLEDLITALRALDGNRNSGPRRDFFGCSIDPPANNKQVFDDLLKKYGGNANARGTLVAELKKQLGPQTVRLFGVPEDSRVAFVMLAADYRLKRLSMGLDASPSGVGSAMGTEAALARLWFEPAYEPLVVSADGLSYELRGPRLKVLAGAQVFQPGGEGPAQRQFAEKLSAKMNDAAGRYAAIADLQNVADCFLVAAIMREDGLLQKAGIRLEWLADAAAYPVAAHPVARTADTIVHIAGNTIASGGVSMSYRAFSGVERVGGKGSGGVAEIAPRRPEETWFITVPPTNAAKTGR